MVGGRHFGAIKPGALFLNTARGEVVNKGEMIEVLRSRPDIQVVLLVTAPEPPVRELPLFDLPNVIVTPHIAGSIGAECQRLGMAMVDEFERFLAGQPMRWELTR